ncbi:MAG: hypothetical protein RLY35_213 [Bacteroidota bacterium]|jgi:FHS family L-fucose permease-like MFS transporter
MNLNNKLFIALLSLFFFWALAHNLNPILIAKLKASFALSDTKAILVDSAFYIAYFIMALPSAHLIGRMGYQKTILMGLGLFALGILSFIPASFFESYAVFLGALLMIGLGITMLEAAANPLITRISSEDQQVYRLNLAQSFNGLGAVVAAGLGGYLLLDDQDKNLPLQTQPFLILGALILMLMLFFKSIKFPVLQVVGQDNATPSASVFKTKAFTLAVVAQFFYVGSQIGVASFFIRYMGQYFAQSVQQSAYLLSMSLVLFTGGRFIGSALMRKWPADRVLFIFSICAMICTLGVINVQSLSFYFILVLPFFMSIMFPTIFALGIGSLQNNKERGGAWIVMTISGGAVIPFGMAQLAQWSGQLSGCYALPLLGFGVVAFFAFYYKQLINE